VWVHDAALLADARHQQKSREAFRVKRSSIASIRFQARSIHGQCRIVHQLTTEGMAANVSCARGSRRASGAAVAYSLGVTTITDGRVGLLGSDACEGPSTRAPSLLETLVRSRPWACVGASVGCLPRARPSQSLE